MQNKNLIFLFTLVPYSLKFSSCCIHTLSSAGRFKSRSGLSWEGCLWPSKPFLLTQPWNFCSPGNIFVLTFVHLCPKKGSFPVAVVSYTPAHSGSFWVICARMDKIWHFVNNAEISWSTLLILKNLPESVGVFCKFLSCSFIHVLH